MKKIKLMLFTLVVVATVGGILAFKAKYTATFCTADAPGQCALPFNATYTVDPNAPLYWFTITNNPNRCGATICNVRTALVAD